jgi:hypothetical protein
VLFRVVDVSFFATDFSFSFSFTPFEDSTGTSIWSKNFVSFLTAVEMFVEAVPWLPVKAVFKLAQLASNTIIIE